jgi:hypothetical protein
MNLAPYYEIEMINNNYLQHLPECNMMQNWSEAYDAMANTPAQFRDGDYYYAYQQLDIKSKTCTCGLQDFKQRLELWDMKTCDHNEDKVKEVLQQFADFLANYECAPGPDHGADNLTLVDGNFYWSGDKDGDSAISREALVTWFLKSRPFPLPQNNQNRI